MDEDLAKLVGMQSVKDNMKRLCKQLSLDIKRKQEGQKTLDAIRHMIFTGNPGVGKTTVSRLVAKLFHQLGVSSKDTVVEVKKGDLVAGYVNQITDEMKADLAKLKDLFDSGLLSEHLYEAKLKMMLGLPSALPATTDYTPSDSPSVMTNGSTAMKTYKKIKEARGGILFVDEAYQLTQALMKGQTDFAGEAIDEMMKVMNNSGRKSTTFVFAGYKKEMDEFVTYNAGIESRIKYRFHFDDYTVKELVVITNLKLQSKGYKLTPDAARDMELVIDKNTNADLRSKYNGRLIDNLLQWASDEMNSRLPLDASGEALITLHKSDFEKAIKRFATARPPTKADPTLLGGYEVEKHLSEWGLDQYSQLFARAGYRQLYDLLSLSSEKDVRALGVSKDADVNRTLQLVERLDEQHRVLSLKMDATFISLDGAADISAWLEQEGLTKFVKLFEQNEINFETLGDLTDDHLKEMGVSEIGPRIKLLKAIEVWRRERDIAKKEAIRAKMNVMNTPPPVLRDASLTDTEKLRSKLEKAGQ
jgi:DNA polymerase III delta prime subunit